MPRNTTSSTAPTKKRGTTKVRKGGRNDDRRSNGLPEATMKPAVRQSGVPTVWTREECVSRTHRDPRKTAARGTVAGEAMVMPRRPPVQHEMIRDGSRSAL